MTYRLDSAGHRVPWGSPLVRAEVVRGSQVVEAKTYCAKCWRDECQSSR